MRLARASKQLLLLDTPPRYQLVSNATARNAYGCAAQEIVCAALQIEPIPINGKCDICFDAESGENFFEIKSVHRNGKVVIYDWRMQKERGAGVPLFYAILVHTCRGERNGSMVFSAMSRFPEILVIPAESVHLIAEKQPARKLLAKTSDPRCGYNRKGYREGYRNLPLLPLRNLVRETQCAVFRLHGIEFSIPISTPP